MVPDVRARAPSRHGGARVTPQERLVWLESALRGFHLPQSGHDSSPVDDILCHTRGLPSGAQGEVRGAIETLFLQTLATEAPPPDRMEGLCELVVRLKIPQVAWHVPDVVERAETFDRRPFKQRVALLHVITDLECPVWPGFWGALAARDQRYVILAVSALLRTGKRAEAEALVPALPKDERVQLALEVLRTLHP